MQENEFEKRVQQKMEEFTLLPKEVVWDQVEARIKKERNRRPMFIWLLAGLMLLGGAGAWWYISDEDATNIATSKGGDGIEKSLEGTSPATNNIKQNHEPVEARQDKAEDTARNNTGNKVDVIASKSGKTASIKKKNIEENVSALRINHLKTKAPVNRSEQPYASKQVNDASSNTAGVYKTKALIHDKDLPLHKHYKTPEDLMRDSIQRDQTLRAKAIGRVDTASLTTVKESTRLNKMLPAKRWRVGFTLYGGLSDNVSGLRVFGAKNFAAFDYLSSNANYNSGTGTTSLPSRLPPIEHNAGASFGVGAFAKRQLSKRIDLTMGFDYHYFSTTSPAGTKTNTSRTVFDSTLFRQNLLSSYYGAGNTTSFVNKYHLLQLPLDFGYRLNKNAGKPIVLSLGVTPALLIGSDALYLDRGSNLYYSDGYQFKNFVVFGQSSLMFTAISTSTFSISAGPAFQYGFNSFSKRQTGTSQHLIFTGIKTNIIFK